MANEAAQLDNLYNSSGVDALVQKVNASISAETRFNAVSQRIEAETPRTSTDALAILDAYSNLSIAQGLIYQGDAALNTYFNTPEATEDDALTAIYTANYNYVYADLYLERAEDMLSIGTGFGTSPAPSISKASSTFALVRPSVSVVPGAVPIASFVPVSSAAMISSSVLRPSAYAPALAITLRSSMSAFSSSRRSIQSPA